MRGYGSRTYATSTQRFFMRAQKLSGGSCPQLLAKFNINTEENPAWDWFRRENHNHA